MIIVIMINQPRSVYENYCQQHDVTSTCIKTVDYRNDVTQELAVCCSYLKLR